MSRRAGFILFLLVLFIGLTLVIVLAFEDALRKNLIEPVLYSLW